MPRHYLSINAEVVFGAIPSALMKHSGARIEPAFCRMCLGYCGVEATIVDDRVVKVKGDAESPLTQGFSCAKGRAIPAQLARPDRLLHTLRRDRPGAFARIPWQQGADEVADRLSHLVQRHGPRSVAMYVGTGSSGYPTTSPVAGALWQAIGSPMRFTPSTIDQPGKAAAAAIHGRWDGGTWSPAEAAVWTFIGTNPLLTMWAGTNMSNPARQLRDGKARGMQVVLIDPRRTELAKFADVHLAVRPGEDPTVLAGLLRLILSSPSLDIAFATRHAHGLEALRVAVEPFTVEVVAQRAGIEPHDLEAAAAIMIRSRRGGISAGTGPNMANRGTLTEYLTLAIHTVCGYWRREGDAVANPGVLISPHEWREQASRRHSPDATTVQRDGAIVRSASGLQTAHVADDILSDAPDRIRALINLGGNPAIAWPGQPKVRAALGRLDLLVTCDIGMSATAELSDVVFGTKFHMETSNVTMNETIRGYGAACDGFHLPFAMYMPPLSVPPAGSEVVEEWQVLHAIARRLHLPLPVNGVDLADLETPTTDDVLDALLRNATVQLAELRRHPRGKVFDISATVGSAEANLPDDQRLRIGDPVMLAELEDVLTETPDPAPFRLVVRRTLPIKNSWGTDFAPMTDRFVRHNPAWLHPDDLTALGLVEGDEVAITSDHGTIRCIAQADRTARPHVVSVSHGWGGPGRAGVNVNELTDSLNSADAVTAIPRMSAIPVHIERVATVAGDH